MGGCEVAGSYWILIILKCLHSTAFFACMSDLGWCQLFQLFLCSVMHIKWTIWALRDVQFSISAAVQSGSAPAPWFSVITHFRTDTVRKSRLFWHERRKKNAAKRGTKKKTLDIQTHLVEKQSRLAQLELFLTSPGTVWMGLSQLGG